MELFLKCSDFGFKRFKLLLIRIDFRLDVGCGISARVTRIAESAADGEKKEKNERPEMLHPSSIAIAFCTREIEVSFPRMLMSVKGSGERSCPERA